MRMRDTGDLVFIENLGLHARIGVQEWERALRQPLFLHLEMRTHASRAAASDDLHDTLDYSAVATRVRAFVEGHAFVLLETLAERIAQLLFDEFNVAWLRLRLAKPDAIPGAGSVGVIIERSRDEIDR